MEVSPLLIDIPSQHVKTDGRPVENGSRANPTRSRKHRESASTVPPSTARHRWYVPCKVAVEFAAALALAIVATPVILVAAALVKLTSRGPAFYTQTRIGKNGRLFTIYKLRTMVHDCESLTGPRWSMPDDPRITRLGQFLRKTHLDELPQLINVLRGDMNLIGPRPERPEFLPKLERAIPHYRQRLAVRPGITGLAQVHLKADTDLESVRRKLVYDFHYIENAGPILDLRILAATVFYILGNPFRLAYRITGAPHQEVADQSEAEEMSAGGIIQERLCA
jgi:lipopolysaccharide/colanic/teichoic acid biosynthesis glycosyltransferase